MKLLAGALLLAAALAGCADVPDADVAPEPQVAGRQPQAVVALVDTGINPYHIDFRDDSQLARQHPSTYLPGYPADAVAVELTLDAADLESALEADRDVWSKLEPGTLYWFPGTKVVAGYSTGDQDSEVGPVFSTGHGTMTASRAAGNGYSLCPSCRIAAVQGFNAESVLWASQQPWIDVQSNSWSPVVVMQQADPAQSPGLAEAFEQAAQAHLVFASAGNGLGGKLGLVGHPSFTRSTSGPRGVVSVGGHDNGQVVLWTGSFPHVVSDACDNWAAVGDSMEDYSPREGGGTSSASPYAAGAAAAIVLEARRLVGDDGLTGTANATLARGAPSANATGPLGDGMLELAEAKHVLFHTAVARPVATEHDGELCPSADLYNTYPVAWQDIPEDVPAYAWVGFGQVSVDSLTAAVEALRTGLVPERADVAQAHAAAEAARDAYNGLPA